MNIQKTIKQARKKLSLTQKQLGVKVGVKENYITKIETGKANPSIALFAKICKALGLELKQKEVNDEK